MEIISQDYKKGFVKLKVEDADDLWYLSHLIDSGDRVRGQTTRKIKIGDNENAKVVKKKVNLTIEAEKIEYQPENKVLRVNGKITAGPEEFPKGSYQNIPLEVGSIFTLEKNHWLSYQKENIKEASEKEYKFLLCLFDREEALFSLSQKFGFRTLSRLKSDLPKKADDKQIAKSSYYTNIIKTLGEYEKRENPQKIILCSPAFYKEDLFKLIKNDDLKKKITLVVCQSVSQSALEEVMRRPELKSVLKESRLRQENLLTEELLTQIGKDENYSYGFVEVKKAADVGAVEKLLVTDNFIKKKREAEKYSEIDQILRTVENVKGEVHIISSDNNPGKKIDGLGGIATINRYKI